jgi:cytochrome o ubiquinol oxidase subunit 2
VLDAKTYADLAKPSQAVAAFSYRAVASNLFNDIVNSIHAADSSQHAHPALKRAQQ